MSRALNQFVDSPFFFFNFNFERAKKLDSHEFQSRSYMGGCESKDFTVILKSKSKMLSVKRDNLFEVSDSCGKLQKINGTTL